MIAFQLLLINLVLMCVVTVKSKRQKTVPTALVGDYHCDKGTLLSVYYDGEEKDYAEKFAKLDDKLKENL